MPKRIDLNCDLGECVERIADGTDAALLDAVTSANVACGGHAGDEATMRATVEAAAARGVGVGAHPAYPDRAGFGRIEIPMSAEQLERCVAEQITALERVAASVGVALSHVKPHGALYHAAMSRPEIARAIASATRASVGPGVILVGRAGAPALDWWRSERWRVAAEAFADRRYEEDGSLRARSLDGAVVEDVAEAAQQAIRVAQGLGVLTVSGGVADVAADTICLHGDTPGAVAMARAVREGLLRAGVRVSPMKNPAPLE